VSEQTPAEMRTDTRDQAAETTSTEAASSPAPDPAAATETPGTSRARRKVRVGVVVSDKMDKTVLVRVDRRVRHPLYKKTVARSNKLAAHDESNDAHVGDTVRVMETRPLSKSKRWRVVEIVERAK
jgi:small subunit ribosomal protein S17